MTYRLVPFPMTLSDRQGHSPNASLFKCDFSYWCANFQLTSCVVYTIPLR